MSKTLTDRDRAIIRQRIARRPLVGLSAQTQALRALGHSYRCIARLRDISTHTVWLALAGSAAGHRTPWLQRRKAERSAALIAAFERLTLRGCTCAAPPSVPTAIARDAEV